MKSRFKVNEWDREFQTKSIQESRRVIKETNVKKKRQSRREWKWTTITHPHKSLWGFARGEVEDTISDDLLEKK